MNNELEQLLQDIWIRTSGVKIDAPEIQATVALIQQERKKAAREALEGVDMVARSIGDLYMADNGSELHDYLLEALKELDGFDWRQGYGGFGYESTEKV